jgi:hypothetical protein
VPFSPTRLAGHWGLNVINLHLRALRASAIPGEKVGRSQWSTTSGSAEGYLLASLSEPLGAGAAAVGRWHSRAGPRAADRRRGRLNAEDYEAPVRLAVAAEEQTGNALRAFRSLMVPTGPFPPTGDGRSCIEAGTRCSITSWRASLSGRPRGVEAHNSRGDGASALHQSPAPRTRRSSPGCALARV